MGGAPVPHRGRASAWDSRRGCRRRGRPWGSTSRPTSASPRSRRRRSAAPPRGAVDNLTRSLALELGPRGIRGVVPSLVATEGTSGMGEAMAAPLVARTPPGRIGQPADVAAAFVVSDGRRGPDHRRNGPSRRRLRFMGGPPRLVRSRQAAGPGRSTRGPARGRVMSSPPHPCRSVPTLDANPCRPWPTSARRMSATADTALSGASAPPRNCCGS